MLRAKKLFFFILVGLSFFLLAGRVQAENELLPSNQVIDSDYVRAGESVQIDGEVRGDVFLMGGLVSVNGAVEGDVFVLGGKVNINGRVGGSVRVVGGDVTVNTPVGRNVALVCGNCTVTPQSMITGSLLATAGNLELSAAGIGRGVRFFGGRLYLNAPVMNEAFVVANNEFLLGPLASVSGDLKYTGTREAQTQPGATVAGKFVYEKTAEAESFPKFFGLQSVFHSFQRFRVAIELVGLFLTGLVGFVLLGLFPRAFEKGVLALERRPAASLGWGVIGALAIPTAALLFGLTVVGIPITIVLAIVLYLLAIGSQYLVAFFIGRKLLFSRFGERRGWALVAGLGLIYLVGYIPVLGSMVKILLTVWALGAMILSYRQGEIVRRETPYEYDQRLRRGKSTLQKRSKSPKR